VETAARAMGGVFGGAGPRHNGPLPVEEER
jgi:hypothetical protein